MDSQIISYLEKLMTAEIGKKGVLLINLGTPQKPAQSEIRRYLKLLLSDPRIMDMSRMLRWLILNLMILPFRPRKILNKYQSIWGEDGFPLLKHSRDLVKKISQKLPDNYILELAMRYGDPSINDSLKRLQILGLNELIIIPLFPQYSSATTGSALDYVFKEISNWQTIPNIRCISSFYDQPEFIKAWIEKAKPLMKEKVDHYVFSFHGLPEQQILKSDSQHHCLQSNDCCKEISPANLNCYRAQCFETAAKIIRGLEVEDSQTSICFQSRLGRSQWIQPSTHDTIKKIAHRGNSRILVFCPSFVADCLETLNEIQSEEAEYFKKYGGGELILVPSLNADKFWVESVLSMIKGKGEKG